MKTPLDELAMLLKNPSHHLSVEVYDERKKRRTSVKRTKGKLTLAKLAEKIDNLGNDLRNEMNAGFKQVNSRIDKIEQRLDYNGLEPLPKENR